MKKSIGAHPIIQPNPVLVIGSYDPKGNPNLMTVSWGGVCCSLPPCVAISPAKRTQTHDNILASRAFTVNIPSASQAREADYVGIYSGRNEDKFTALGLTPVKSEVVNAPYAAEFALVLECTVINELEIGEHTCQFIGEILDIKADAGVLDEKGLPDITKVRPFIYDHTGGRYFILGDLLAKAFSIGKKQ